MSPSRPRAAPRLIAASVLGLVFALLTACATASMSPTQITGNYKLVKFCPTCQSTCPEHLYFRAVEVPVIGDVDLYVIAHSNIYYREKASEIGKQCSAMGVSPTSGLKVSSTVLRSMDEVTVDKSIDLLAAFYNSPNDVFYLGYEVGSRVCGTHEAPDQLVSLWAVPSSTIRGTHDGREITFQPGVKYLYYFDPKVPCLYEGNVAETGETQKVSTTASAISNPNSITPGSAVAGPDGQAIGTVTNEGTIITSAGPIQADAAEPTVMASPAPPSPSSPVTTSGGTIVGTSGGAGSTGGTAQFDARDNPECLPGSARLQRVSGEELTVREARVGDVVATGRRRDGSLEYGEIFAFSHSDARATSKRPLVSIKIVTGSRVRLTQGHLVPVRDIVGDSSCDATGLERLIAAGDAQVGRDCLYDMALGKWVAIEAVVHGGVGVDLREEGLYNPHTLAGTVAVDGLLVSCYTTALRPWEATVLLRTVHAFGAGWAVPWVAGLYRNVEVFVRSLVGQAQEKAVMNLLQCSNSF